jgi:hypothetical protein
MMDRKTSGEQTMRALFLLLAAFPGIALAISTNPKREEGRLLLGIILALGLPQLVLMISRKKVSVVNIPQISPDIEQAARARFDASNKSDAVRAQPRETTERPAP